MGGETKAITDSDIVEQALAAYKQFPDYLPLGAHTTRVLERLEGLQPKVLAGHHTPAFSGNVARALRDFRSGLFKIAAS